MQEKSARRDLLKELQDGEYEMINYWYINNEVRGRVVIHIFCRDFKCNPYVHTLVTEGVTDKEINW